MGLSNYVAHYISFHTTLVNVVYANGLENLIQQQDHAPLRKRLFTGLVSAVTIRFLDLSGVVVLTKRSSGKPFKFLDMYETLWELVPAVEESDSDLIHEIKLAQTRLGEASVTIFGELENSIKTDIGRTPVPSGGVHPVTQWTTSKRHVSTKTL